MKWLQSLNEIVIDRRRCRTLIKSLWLMSTSGTKTGEIISGYPDVNNHNIDAIRYATEHIWRRRDNEKLRDWLLLRFLPAWLRNPYMRKTSVFGRSWRRNSTKSTA